MVTTLDDSENSSVTTESLPSSTGLKDALQMAKASEIPARVGMFPWQRLLPLHADVTASSELWNAAQRHAATVVAVSPASLAAGYDHTTKFWPTRDNLSAWPTLWKTAASLWKVRGERKKALYLSHYILGSLCPSRELVSQHTFIMGYTHRQAEKHRLQVRTEF